MYYVLQTKHGDLGYLWMIHKLQMTERNGISADTSTLSIWLLKLARVGVNLIISQNTGGTNAHKPEAHAVNTITDSDVTLPPKQHCHPVASPNTTKQVNAKNIFSRFISEQLIWVQHLVTSWFKRIYRQNIHEP